MTFGEPGEDRGEFSGLRVYYSGSIKGVPEPDSSLPWKLVQYMAEHGADVLSEHVAARSVEEMENIRSRRMGERIREINESPEPWFGIRKQDNDWVDAATHVIALVNSPSHGVGMEIERAIYKAYRGLNVTPILCLVREDLLPTLSNMVRGVSPDETAFFFLRTYSTLEEAQVIIHEFLLNRYV